jgi:hypothetical protein
MVIAPRKIVESYFTMENGYPANAHVIYGDTDSVMVDFGVEDLSTAMDLGRKAAAHVTTSFIRPIQLEFEKCYYPYLLINKKRYAGLFWTKPDKFDKMDTKGIEVLLSFLPFYLRKRTKVQAPAVSKQLPPLASSLGYFPFFFFRLRNQLDCSS